ncbi:MAG: type I restriction endonuclease [Polyangiales bacterium]
MHLIYDDDPDERTVVELPLAAQLAAMGWTVHDAAGGGLDDLGRASFRDVLLLPRLRAALVRLNPDAQGNPWLDAPRVAQAEAELLRLGGRGLMEANRAATERITRGVLVAGPEEGGVQRDRPVRFIDFEHPERNDLLAVRQMRFEPPGTRGDGGAIVPDLVLYVNGIPLAVVECKSPLLTQPMGEAIEQLRRYSNQRGSEAPEGVEALFHYAQVLAATSFFEARVGTVGSRPQDFLAWKTTAPRAPEAVAKALGVASLMAQQTLAAGVFEPAHLLTLVRHFVLHLDDGAGRPVKVLARYQQFRAVTAAVARLRQGRAVDAAGVDRRSGLIWHTQGSGKSLTMVFLVRMLRATPELRAFKVVVVTDRKDLERQLAATAALTGETVRRVTGVDGLETLREAGPDLVFVMIQKYLAPAEGREVLEVRVPYEVPTPAPDGLAEAGPKKGAARKEKVFRQTVDEGNFPVLDDSPAVLVLVDEAHRSHAAALHRRLSQALPHAAMIGFTGTPIPADADGHRRGTEGIFGSVIDSYTLKQSEADGATLKILYEGRTTDGEVVDAEGRTIDGIFADMFRGLTDAQRESLKQRYATKGDVMEAARLIEAKAADMLRHYVTQVMPSGFKAQVVASSRLGAVRYQKALADAQRALLARVDALPDELRARPADGDDALDAETRYLVHAWRQRAVLARLEFAAVISASQNQDPQLDPWSHEPTNEQRIARFKRPLVHADPAKADGLAILCVNSMLLTGFDAPLEQALYLDRFMQGHELLQAIARVNRTAPGKTHGVVVDYFGVGAHLSEALKEYSEADRAGVLTDLGALIPELRDQRARVMAFFAKHGLGEPIDVQAAVALLEDVKVRAAFLAVVTPFLTTFEAVSHRPEAQPFAADVKRLGFIARVAANLYRDVQIDLPDAGKQVRKLIDDHVRAVDITQAVPPVSVTAADFEQAVGRRPDARAKAAEMAHALRHHINLNFDTDPARYRSLKQRIEEAIEAHQDRFEEILDALRPMVAEVQAAAAAVAESGADAVRGPFERVLLEEAEADGPLTPERRAGMAALAAAVVEVVREAASQVDFWKSEVENERLLSRLAILLDGDADLPPAAVFPFDRQTEVAARLVKLARDNRRHFAQ